MDNRLWSSDLGERYEATLKHAGDAPVSVGMWPRACWGSANCWLMLVGPSPGRADSVEEHKSGGGGRPEDQEVFIGPGTFLVNFNSNKARNDRWQMIPTGIMGDVAMGAALTAMTNLDWGNFGNHEDIPEVRYAEGCGTVFRVMEQARPRVVITLVTRTWDYMRNYLYQYRVDYPAAPPVMRNAPMVFRLPGNSFNTVLIKSPQHPSRHFFKGEHVMAMKKVVDWFIACESEARDG